MADEINDNPEAGPIETEPAFEPEVLEPEVDPDAPVEPAEPPAPRTPRGLITELANPKPQQQNGRAPAAPQQQAVQLDADTLSEINDIREAAGPAAAALFQRQAEKAAKLEQQMAGLNARTNQVSDAAKIATEREVHQLINGTIDEAAADPALLKLVGKSWETCNDAQAATRARIARIAAGIHHGDPTMTEQEAIMAATNIAAGTKPAATKSQAVQQVQGQVQRAANRQTTPPVQRTGKAPANPDPRAAAVDRLNERMKKAGLSK